MRRVSVYRRADTYYVRANSKATTGLWVETGDIEVLPTSTPDAERDGPVIVTPTRRDGPHGGYAHLPDQAVTVASTELARLGSVVRELLAAKD